MALAKGTGNNAWQPVSAAGLVFVQNQERDSDPIEVTYAAAPPPDNAPFIILREYADFLELTFSQPVYVRAPQGSKYVAGIR